MTRKDVFWLSVLTSAISTPIFIMFLDVIGDVRWRDIPMSFIVSFIMALIIFGLIIFGQKIIKW